LAGISSLGISCLEYELHVDKNMQELAPYDYETITEAENQDTDTYGIFTNVASYVNWIVQNSDYTGCQLSKYLQEQKKNNHIDCQLIVSV